MSTGYVYKLIMRMSFKKKTSSVPKYAKITLTLWDFGIKGILGGYVTKNHPEFRQRRLLFTVKKQQTEPKEDDILNTNGKI